MKKIPVILCDNSCLNSLLPNSNVISTPPLTDSARKAWMRRPTRTTSLGCLFLKRCSDVFDAEREKIVGTQD